MLPLFDKSCPSEGILSFWTLWDLWLRDCISFGMKRRDIFAACLRKCDARQLCDSCPVHFLSSGSCRSWSWKTPVCCRPTSAAKPSHSSACEWEPTARSTEEKNRQKWLPRDWLICLQMFFSRQWNASCRDPLLICQWSFTHLCPHVGFKAVSSCLICWCFTWILLGVCVHKLLPYLYSSDCRLHHEGEQSEDVKKTNFFTIAGPELQRCVLLAVENFTAT